MDGFEQDSPKPHTGDIRKPGEVDTGLRGFENFLVISGMLPEINWLLGSLEQGLVKEQIGGATDVQFPDWASCGAASSCQPLPVPGIDGRGPRSTSRTHTEVFSPHFLSCPFIPQECPPGQEQIREKNAVSIRATVS